jgi:hypothetical protein
VIVGRCSPARPPMKRFRGDGSSAGGTGFEPLVPQKTPGILVLSVVVRVDFSVAEIEPGRDESALKSWSCRAGPVVRILFPPAASHVRT